MQTYEDLLRKFIIPWQNIRRWRGKPRPKHENVLMHTFKECMNTLYALSLEKDSAHQPDHLKVLVAKLFHDIGEGLLGCDIPFPIKTDKRLDGVFEEIEEDDRMLFLNQLGPETKKYLTSALKLLSDKRTIEGRICDAIEIYGYITFAIAEIKTEGKGNPNVIGSYHVLMEHGDKMTRHQKFQFVKNLKEISARLDKSYFTPDVWLPEITLRRVLDSWTDSRLGRAWPDLETNENLLERTMKTAFLAAFLIPQEIAFGKKMDGYKILCTALVHKLDKISFPVLAPRMRQNKKLRKYERAFRQLQKEHLLPLLNEYPAETKDIILNAYALERDHESAEGRYFDAIKNLSYVLFAYYEWSRGKTEFRQVFENCDADLMEYCKEFKSIAEIYLPIKADFEKGEQDKSNHAEILKKLGNLEKEKEEMEKRLKKLEGKK